jgi:hypothetical protein
VRYNNQKLTAYAIMKIRSIRFAESEKIEIIYAFESDIQSELKSQSEVEMKNPTTMVSHNQNGIKFLFNPVFLTNHIISNAY